MSFMRIQHNIAALNSHRNLGNNNSAVSKNLEKLSSGYRINRAGDDAAGLAISEKMRAQIKGLETASKNAENGISLIQTAEGALTEVHSMLNRMVELATQSANGTYGTTERQKIQDEVTNLMDEIDRIASSTDFNGTKLLDGTLGGYSLIDTAPAGGPVAFHANGIIGIDITGGNLDGTEEFNFELVANGTVTLSEANANTPAEMKFVAVDADGNVADFAKGVDGVGKVDPSKGGSITYKAVFDETSGTLTAADKEKWEGVTITVSLNAAEKNATTGLRSGYDTAANNANSGVINTKLKQDGTGAATNGLKLQVGDTNDDFQKVNVRVQNMNSTSLGLDAISVMSQDKAGASILNIKNAIEKVSTQRGQLGALQNRLDHTINNLGVTTENMTAAESRIRDVDMAQEMMGFTKNNILTQAAQAMLAQANQVPQGVLQLLQ